MSRPFDTRMPEHPPHQKHAEPRRSDNLDFFDDLDGGEAFDENLQWFFNRIHDHTKVAGGKAFGLHSRAPGPNGYTRITTRVSGHLLTRRLKPHELHQENWTAGQVAGWRRGRTRLGPHPLTYAQVCRYCRKRGGQPVGELKSPAFGVYPWILEQLVATAKRYDVAPWFKALANMTHPAAKCANTINAGGQFALIFGTHIKGRGARLAAGRKITATWRVKPTRIW